MNGRRQLVGTLILALAASGCGGERITNVSPPATSTPLSTASLVPAATSVPSRVPSGSLPAASTVPNAMDVPDFAELEPATYSMHLGHDRAGTLRVLFTIPAKGWQRFVGAFKETANGFVGVNFYDVRNVVTEACEDHTAANPPVGPTVDDLAAAAAALQPFELTSPPADVEAYGYRGKHLELVVPEIPYSREDGWTECQDGELKTWIAPPLSYAFYGYNRPGQVEELWILQVEDRRLMISAISHPDSPAADVAELRRILDSLHIQP